MRSGQVPQVPAVASAAASGGGLGLLLAGTPYLSSPTHPITTSRASAGRRRAGPLGSCGRGLQIAASMRIDNRMRTELRRDEELQSSELPGVRAASPLLPWPSGLTTVPAPSYSGDRAPSHLPVRLERAPAFGPSLRPSARLQCRGDLRSATGALLQCLAGDQVEQCRAQPPDGSIDRAACSLLPSQVAATIHCGCRVQRLASPAWARSPGPVCRPPAAACHRRLLCGTAWAILRPPPPASVGITVLQALLKQPLTQQQRHLPPSARRHGAERCARARRGAGQRVCRLCAAGHLPAGLLGARWVVAVGVCLPRGCGSWPAKGGRSAGQWFTGGACSRPASHGCCPSPPPALACRSASSPSSSMRAW